MEVNQPKTGKFAWTYGLLAGGAGVIFSLMLYFMDMIYIQNMAINIIPYLLLGAAVILAIVQYKKANSGFLKTVDGVKLGAGIGLVAAILSVIYFALLTNVIEPDFMDKTMEVAKVKAFEDNPQITDEQWNQGVEMQKKFAWLGYPIALIFYTLIGLIIGAITGAIMNNRRPE